MQGSSFSEHVLTKHHVHLSIVRDCLGILTLAVTFVLGVCFRLERLSIHERAGKAKLVGTVLGIAGAMLLTFYKGVEVHIPSVNILRTSHIAKHTHNNGIGSLLALGGCFSYASWFIIQARMSRTFPYHFTSTTLMSLMAAVQALVWGICSERNWANWKLGLNVRLAATTFSGIIGSAGMATLITWCIRLKGPLFVSVFSPVMLLILTIVESFILKEKLFVSSVLGGLVIVFGLYLVLWGKGQEVAVATTRDGEAEERAAEEGVV